MKYDIVTIGDASEDVFVRPSEVKISDSRSVVSGKVMSFELGEKIEIDQVQYEIGGSACNLAVGLARLGLKSQILTAVGKDSPSERVFLCLEDEAVNTDEIYVSDQIQTNFAVVINTPDGERTILVYHGLKDYREVKVKKSLNAEWLFLAPMGEHSEEIEATAIGLAAEKGVKIAWNPGGVQIRQGVSKHRPLLRNTSVLFLNREEAIKFTDYPVRPKDEEVMRRLHNLGVGVVVMTKGKAGVKMYDGTVFYKMDIIKDIKRIDATGAGDSFASGFLGKLILAKYSGDHNKELMCEALKYGIVNSTSVVAKIGAQPGLLDLVGMEREISTRPRLQAEIYN